MKRFFTLAAVAFLSLSFVPAVRLVNAQEQELQNTGKKLEAKASNSPNGEEESGEPRPVVASSAITNQQPSNKESGSPRAQAAGKSATELKVELTSAVKRALETSPAERPELITPESAGVRLLDLKVNEKHHEIVVNLTQHILNYGIETNLEFVLRHIISTLGEVDTGWTETNYKVLLDGTPLKEILAPFDSQVIGEPKAKAPTLEQKQDLASGSLSSKRVVISPGHGWVWRGNGWGLQRGYHEGIVEDFVNAEIVMLLNEELKSTGADIRPSRNLDKRASNGDTGHPKWEEAAKYHIKAQGVPTSVWDTGDSDLNKDITSRPLYANEIGADIMVSVHNNGGKGTGTETFIDPDNGHEKESRRLATAVHNKVVNAIRTQYDPNWKDRGVKTCSMCYGENRFATRPAILIEVAFMDQPKPDNAALRDEKFRKIVAAAIKQGIEEYFGVSQPTGNFSLSVVPFSASVTQGSRISFTLAVKSLNGFKGKVQLAAKRLPGDRVIQGTGWQPTTVTPAANGTAYTTFTLATDAKTPTGTFNLELEGSSGGITKRATVQLVVNPAGNFSLSVIPFTATIAQGSRVSFSVGIKSINGFRGRVLMAAKKLPGNRVISDTGWYPAALTPPSNGTAFTTFLLATDARTPTGTYYIDLEASNGTVIRRTTVQLIITGRATFNLAASPTTATVRRGSKISFTVGVKSVDGFRGKVELAAKNLPGHRVIRGTAWRPSSITPPANRTAFSTFTLATDNKTPLGTFYIDLEGTNKGVTRRKTIRLTVKRK